MGLSKPEYSSFMAPLIAYNSGSSIAVSSRCLVKAGQKLRLWGFKTRCDGLVNQSAYLRSTPARDVFPRPFTEIHAFTIANVVNQEYSRGVPLWEYTPQEDELVDLCITATGWSTASPFGIAMAWVAIE